VLESPSFSVVTCFRTSHARRGPSSRTGRLEVCSQGTCAGMADRSNTGCGGKTPGCAGVSASGIVKYRTQLSGSGMSAGGFHIALGITGLLTSTGWSFT
jgi:hypothetical protein